MVRSALIASLACSAAAFAPSQVGRAASAVSETKADLEAIAAKSNPVLKFYDPLELSDSTIFGDTQDATIGFLRQAEIKHGRVSMAAFVGYCLQSNGVHWPWPTATDGTPFPFEAGSPPEQWDALSDAAKWQIILFIGFLEIYSEHSFILEKQGEKHYMKGGTPGYYPKFDTLPHPVPIKSLYDPFGSIPKMTEEQKAKRLNMEINNGRLAMIGLFGFISEASVPGSVPALSGIVAPYDGNVMAPFL